MNYSFLNSDRLYFRPLEVNDIENGYINWINDPEIRSYMGTLHFPTTKEQLKDYVCKHTSNPNIVFFAIVDKTNNKHIGNIKLGPIDWINRKGEHGFLIGDKEYWGKGFGSEALTLLLRYAFLELNLNKINASFSSLNIASIKVHEKVGFTVEGKRRQEKYENGIYNDIILVGITREEFLQKYPL